MCVPSLFVWLASSLCLLACCLLSLPDSRSVVLEHSSRHEPRYFLFLLFFGLGGQICLWVDQSVHIVLETSITLSLLVAAENERDPEVDVLKKGGRRRQGSRGSGFAERNMFKSIWVVYRIMHLGFFLPPFRVSRAARVACSNTSLTPSFVLAEHSRYLVAPIFLRTSSAWEGKSVYQSCLHPAPSCVLYLRWWCVPVPG